jgi:hypothetical protein
MRVEVSFGDGTQLFRQEGLVVAHLVVCLVAETAQVIDGGVIALEVGRLEQFAKLK